MASLRLPSVAIAVAAALLLPVTTASGQQIQVNKDNRSISVTASAEATAEADTAVVHVGFVVYGPDQQTAYARGSTASNAIAQALNDAGVPKDAIESENQSIMPVPFEDPQLTPAQRAERKFQVQQSWTAKTAAKNAAAVLDAAVKAGANQSGQIDWTLADDAPLEAKAAGVALERARAIGEQMAHGLGTTLGPLIYASNQAPSEPVVRAGPAQMFTAMGKSQEVRPLSISTRKVVRSATVAAVFAIQ